MLITRILFCLFSHVEVLVITLLAQNSGYKSCEIYWGHVLCTRSQGHHVGFRFLRC
jgi:hypothetical protein